jgi:hypothetical protein
MPHATAAHTTAARTSVSCFADAVVRQELLTALTTEHFTLQGARSQTMSESASRTTLYIGAVSSALVALGFIGQVSEVGGAFNVFALTVLPTLYVLGAFTFVRVVECGAEDFRYGLAVNRIRGHHRQVAGDQANLTGGIEPMFPSRQQEGQGGRRDFCSLRLREGLQEADARPTE